MGGCIRDLLTDIEPKDFDIVTNAKPDQIRALIKNSKIIGRRFRLVHVYSSRRSETVEVATFRRAPRTQRSRKGDVAYVERDNDFGRFHQDPYRRDFGINSLYFDPKSGNLYDFVNARRDFETQTIRSVGDPLIRFAEDPVRMLRAARFAAKLDYSIDPAITNAIDTLKHTLVNVKPRRMADEVDKLFLHGYGSSVLAQMQALDLMVYVFLHPVEDPRILTETVQRADSLAGTKRPMQMPLLLACFLWQSFQDRLKKLPQTHDFRLDIHRAGRQVLSDLADSVGIPKHMRTTVQEIWELQALLERRNKRLIRNLLQHGQFHQAISCLELRQVTENTTRDTLDWWTKLMHANEQQKNEMIDALPRGSRRRRRRKSSKRRN